MNYDAAPGLGLGVIRLGMSPSTVTDRLGAPNDQVYDGDELRLDYDPIKTNCFFGYEGFNRLHLIECRNPKLRVVGQKIIGTTTNGLSRRLGFSSADEEITDYGDGECFHGFPGISCYSNSSIVLSVQVTLLFDDNDCEVWPFSDD